MLLNAVGGASSSIVILASSVLTLLGGLVVASTATMWLVPLVRDHAGWCAALAMLAPGPLLGAWALRGVADGRPDGTTA